EPWKLWKAGEKEKTATILHVCNQIVANLSALSEPFLPFTAQKMRKMLNFDRINWHKTGSLELVESGHAINQAEFLFEKIEDATIQQQRQKLSNRAPEKQAPEQQPIKEEVNFDDFTKLDIRTGKIMDAEKIPKANKLLKVKVDIGVEKRIVVAGIAQQYEPQDIIGQRVSILANLAPKKLKGVESHGMMLMAEDKEGNLTFLQPADDLPVGSVVR
ncbi:MAG: methionine--tRNA ligase subunit beta, partial [Bacteroidetes bacterium SW_10_40_5]